MPVLRRHAVKGHGLQSFVLLGGYRTGPASFAAVGLAATFFHSIKTVQGCRLLSFNLQFKSKPRYPFFFSIFFFGVVDASFFCSKLRSLFFLLPHAWHYFVKAWIFPHFTKNIPLFFTPILMIFLTYLCVYVPMDIHVHTFVFLPKYLCMYACMYACNIYVVTCDCTCVIFMCLCLYVYMCTCNMFRIACIACNVCTHSCMYAMYCLAYIHVCMYLCMRVFVYLCIYLVLYIYISMWICMVLGM